MELDSLVFCLGIVNQSVDQHQQTFFQILFFDLPLKAFLHERVVNPLVDIHQHYSHEQRTKQSVNQSKAICIGDSMKKIRKRTAEGHPKEESLKEELHVEVLVVVSAQAEQSKQDDVADP
jgi:hypothetical protein